VIHFHDLEPARAVKVCGLTQLDDVDAAVAAGADLFGFIAPHTPSPRAVSLERLAALVARAPQHRSVLVVVDTSARAAAQLALDCGAAAVQICGAAAAGDFADFPLPLLRALSVDRAGTAQAWDQTATAFVFEPARSIGGSGRLAALADVARVASGRRALLAGGLDAGNVGERLAALPPIGADASSGLEHAPGRKDPQRVRAFVAAARAAIVARSRRVTPCS
jgi:phosphoribosylanthranilate isomerase